MAEALALASSVVAIIQIADRVISLCKWYIETARDAPADIRAILIETSTTKSILETLHFLDSCDDGLSATLSSLVGDGGPVEGCRRAIEGLEGLFPSDGVPVDGNRSKTQKIDHALKVLAWPFKEKKAKKLLEELIRYKTTINLAVSTESL